MMVVVAVVGGWVKFLHIERKITSVVHSHGPSHCIRANALGWRLVMFTLPTARKTKLNAFASNMRRTISSFLVVFGMALSCFSVWRASPHPSPQQAVCGMPPLTSQPFGVTCVLRFPFHTRATRGLWGTESQIAQHRLYNVPLSSFGFLPGLGTNENLQWAFSLEKWGVRKQLASSHVNSQSLLNPRRGLLEKTQGKGTQGMRQDSCEAHSLWKKTKNVHVNLHSPWTQDALSLKKHMETGRVSATHVLVEKRYGIRKRLVACQMNLQSHWRQNTWEHTGNLGGLVQRAFSLKNTWVRGGGSCVAYTLTVKMKAKRILHEKT